MATHAPVPRTSDVLLRDVTEEDLPILFEQQMDPEANRMAAFPARGRDAFMVHWAKILSDAATTKKAILFEGQIAGHIGSFEQSGRALVGYWIGRQYWGKGIATKALSALLDQVEKRPLYAYVAKHNLGSIRVLEKCGFTMCDDDQVAADADGEDMEEVLLVLRGT
jgi:RimJ/RimL family protein N-acetyltransferase